MRTSARRVKPAVRLNCETLEDRVTPAIAYALTGAGAGVGSLLAFDTATPGVVTTTAITNINANDTLVGIDFRPQNGLLYGLGVNAAADTATLYAISTRTGQAAAVGGVGAITGAGDLQAPSATVGYGFDFNPAVDRIRVVSGSLNFRVDPNSGTLTASDTALTLGGAAATLDGSAYTNNLPNVSTTVLFGIDAATDTLYVQGATNPPGPNGGVLTAVGTTLGVDFTAATGFDISSTGAAFAALTVGGVTGLYSVNLTTGTATLVGALGAAVQGLAVQSEVGGSPAVALGAGGTSVVRFNTASPGTATTAAITAGLVAGDALVALDVRPNTGQYFALGVNTANNTLQLYRVNPQNVAGGVDSASLVAIGAPITNALFPAATTFPAGGYGFDFNPTAANGDTLIRVTTATGLNFRLNPNTGAVAGVDTVISGSGVTGISSTAYTNSFGQGAGGVTTQYTLDAASNSLLIQGPVGAVPAGPNGGVQGNRLPVTVGGQPLDFTDVTGFDIPGGVRVTASGTPTAGGFGFATLTVGGATRLYRINLVTGAADDLGATAAGLTGLTVGDTTGGVVSFQSATVTGNEGGSGINVVLTRTGGTGPQAVTVNVTGGTATAADLVQDGPYTVVFADGATTATLNIRFINDSLLEGPETLTLAVGALSNGLLGARTTTTITVNDTAQPFAQAFGTASGAPLVAFVPSGSTTPTVFNPYQGTGLAGGIRVATGDVNGDGIDDLVTINAVGAPLVKVFSGAGGGQLASFQAYPTTINIPASLAVGDVNGDGFDDIILSTTTTIAAVVTFSGRDFTQLGVFLPGNGIPLGFNVASGDVNRDGFDDIILGTTTGLSVIATFSGRDNSLMNLFLPFGNLALGTNVAVGDLDGDGLLDLVAGTNSTVPAVVVFNGRAPTTQATVFFPFGAAPGGASVGVSDVNGDGVLDIVAGTTAGGASTRAFNGRTLAPFTTISPFGNFGGGVFVG